MLPARRTTTTCASPIYPPAVIQSVTEQMRAYYNKSMQQQHKEDSDAADARASKQTMIPESAAAYDVAVPRTMRVKPCLQRANLRDAVVRTKKQAKKNYVRLAAGLRANGWLVFS